MQVNMAPQMLSRVFIERQQLMLPYSNAAKSPCLELAEAFVFCVQAGGA